jgi:hypothetical protein
VTGYWLVMAESGRETLFRRAASADEALTRQEAAEESDDHGVLAIYVQDDLAFYRYSGRIYVCAMGLDGKPRVADAIPAEVIVSVEIAEMFRE